MHNNNCLRELKIKNDCIVFQKVEKPEHNPYEIPINIIGEIRKVHNINCSKWLLHLSIKTWITPELLIEFSDQVKKLIPYNNINWTESFIRVRINQNMEL